MKKLLTLVLALLLALGLVATANAHTNRSCYRDDDHDGYCDNRETGTCTNRGQCYVDESQHDTCVPHSGHHHGGHH